MLSPQMYAPGQLTLLPPVTVRAHGTPIAKRKPCFIEVLAYLALREHGATPEEVAAACGYNLSTIRNSVKVVRDWLGINPRTGERHLPEASKSRAAQVRGIPVSQVNDLLVDIDLFRRLRLRGQARGDHGINDLVAHHVSARFLATGDIRRARAATETALLGALYDAMTRLDLAVVTKAEGYLDMARQIVHDVCNEPDEDGLPSDLSERIGAVIARMGWLEAS